ncbi:MAG: aldo/keto reductase [Candidatus Heimdallarchaeota archaeon]|nr:aldo/keto reductase [Candidatus Heimdallarchaeota archaeon]
MKYRLLGKTGIRVSELSLGSMGWGGAQYQYTDQPVNKEDAVNTLKKALELDINYIDCADIYGAYGNAEKIIGETLKGYEREELFISSKVMMPMSRNEFDRGLNRKHLIKSIDRTLNNFNTEYVDLYYAHRFDHTTPLENVIRTMNSLIQHGKIRYWGTSNWSPAELERTFALCERYGWEGPVVDQTRYTLLHRYSGEFALQYVMDYHGLGLVPYKILLEGLFAGAYTSKPFSELVDSEKQQLQSIIGNNPLTEDLYNKIRRYDEIAKDLEITPAQLSYAWILQVDNVSSALMSTRKPHRVEENLEALTITLSEDTKKEINQLFPPETDAFLTYNMIKARGGPNLIGKITEEMMKF